MMTENYTLIHTYNLSVLRRIKEKSVFLLNIMCLTSQEFNLSFGTVKKGVNVSPYSFYKP